LIVFLVVVLGVGFAIGLSMRPGEWYQSLEKPAFTPPNWVFGPVWTAAYVLIAVAGWRVALTEGFRSKSFGLWAAQMILNWSWTPIFFGAHLIAPGFATILALLAVAVLFMFTADDRMACWSFAPYVAWLAYAATLNGAIMVLNSQI
jgi:tryptophan-rich sensory protein